MAGVRWDLVEVSNEENPPLQRGGRQMVVP